MNHAHQTYNLFSVSFTAFPCSSRVFSRNLVSLHEIVQKRLEDTKMVLNLMIHYLYASSEMANSKKQQMHWVLWHIRKRTIPELQPMLQVQRRMIRIWYKDNGAVLWTHITHSADSSTEKPANPTVHKVFIVKSSYSTFLTNHQDLTKHTGGTYTRDVGGRDSA